MLTDPSIKFMETQQDNEREYDAFLDLGHDKVSRSSRVFVKKNFALVQSEAL